MTATSAAAILTTSSTDGTTIAYEKVGTGPALIVVDGALCHRNFGGTRELAELISTDFTVYFYDRRGRGASSDAQPYAVGREIEDLRAMTDVAGGEPFVLGFSSGAALALEASAAGVPMRRLAAYESPYLGPRVKNGKPIDDVAVLKQFVAKGDRGAAVGHFMVNMVGAPFFVPAMMRLMPKIWKQLKAVAHTLPYDATVMNGFVVPTERLAKITVPTLVMRGGKAKADMIEGVENVAAVVPGSELRVLDGQTHQVAPAAIAPELTRFFV